jgi:hypothetical protein
MSVSEEVQKCPNYLEIQRFKNYLEITALKLDILSQICGRTVTEIALDALKLALSHIYHTGWTHEESVRMQILVPLL